MHIAQLQACFLDHFAARGLPRRFAEIDPAAGQLPLKAAGFACATPKQYALSIGYDYRNGTVNSLVTGIDTSSLGTTP